MHAPVREGAVWCELAEPGGPSVPCLSSQSFSLLQHMSAPCAPGLHPYGGPRAASATEQTQRRPLGSPSRLQPHPPAMNLIRRIDPDSYLLGGWQLAPGGLNTEEKREGKGSFFFQWTALQKRSCCSRRCRGRTKDGAAIFSEPDETVSRPNFRRRTRF